MIRILKPGFYASVQDTGRFGYLSDGVGRCGAMDALALKIGNAAIGNPDTAAAVEFTFGGFEVEATRDIEICIGGSPIQAKIDGKPIHRWWAQTLPKGQRLSVGPCASGMRSYLCVAGGIDVPTVLGSKSTDLKGGFGGLSGRLLKAGDVLDVGAAYKGREMRPKGLSPREFPDLFRDFTVCPTLRFIPAREWEDLNTANQRKFLDEEWAISPDSNRVGYRLNGVQICPKVHKEMLSHGILPGTIQLPPSGQPVVQMRDANTAGGYPKLGKVIEADMSVLAQVPIGKSIRFTPCSIDEAKIALRTQNAQSDRVRNIMNGVRNIA